MTYMPCNAEISLLQSMRSSRHSMPTHRTFLIKQEGVIISNKLQCTLPAMPLHSSSAHVQTVDRKGSDCTCWQMHASLT